MKSKLQLQSRTGRALLMCWYSFYQSGTDFKYVPVTLFLTLKGSFDHI